MYRSQQERGEYYFIEYSSCRFRTTRAFPGRTGGVSLEESEEEEEEGGERDCRGQTLPGCSRVAASHQEPSILCGGHHRGPRRSGLFGDTERGHLWDVAWLGQAQLRGTSLASPPQPLPCQLIQGGRRWDTPRGGHKDICHSWVPRHDLALAHGHGGWGFLLSSLPGGGKDQLQISRSPNLQILLAPSPGRGWKVVDNKTNKKNVGHVIDC